MAVKDVCRICLSDSEPKLPVFTDNGESGMSIPQKIMSLARVQVVKGDGLPTHLCVKCFYLVETFVELRELCEKSYNKLIMELISISKSSSSSQLVPKDIDEPVKKTSVIEKGQQKIKEGRECLDSPAVQITVVSSVANVDDVNGGQADLDVDSTEEIRSSASQKSLESIQHSKFDKPPSPVTTSEQMYNDYFQLNFTAIGNGDNVSYQCLKCGVKYRSIKECKGHIQRVFHELKTSELREGSRGKITCYTCDAKFSSTRSLGIHITHKHRSTPFTFTEVTAKKPKLEEISENESEPQTDMKSERKSSLGMRHCDDCNVSVKNWSGHSRTIKHQTLCLKNLGVTGEATKVTEIKREPQSLLDCPGCSTKFSSREGLKLHVQKRHRNYQVVYSCDLCDSRQFFSKSKCRKHMVEDHGEANPQHFPFEIHPAKSNESKEKGENTNDVSINKFECTYCHKKYLNFSECLEHLFISHRVSNAQKINILRVRVNDKDKENATIKPMGAPKETPQIDKRSPKKEVASSVPLEHPPVVKKSPIMAHNFQSLVGPDCSLHYKCLGCGMLCRNYRAAYGHYSKLTSGTKTVESKLFRCNSCQMRFVSRNLLMSHRNIAHKSLKSLRIKNVKKLKIKKLIPPKQDTEAEPKTEPEPQSNSIALPKQSPEENIIKAPIKDLNDSKVRFERIILCKNCHKTFESAKVLAEHKLDCGKTDNEVLYCSTCDTYFAIKTEFEEHIKQNSCGNLLTCKLCNKLCKSKSHLSKHEASHGVPKEHKERSLKLKCPDCEKVFDSNFRLKRHCLTSHQQEEVQEGQDEMTYDSAPKAVELGGENDKNPTGNTPRQEDAASNQLSAIPETCSSISIPASTALTEPEPGQKALEGSGKQHDPLSSNSVDGIKKEAADDGDGSTDDEDGNFFCNLCDRTFKKEDALICHLSSELHINMRMIKLSKNRLSDSKDK